MKRVLIFTVLVASILMICLACDLESLIPTDPVGPVGPVGPVEPAITDFNGDGPYATANDQNSGASGASGVHYPANLDEGPFPLFVWGAGAGTGPRQYIDHMNRIASYGFICISNASDGGNMHTQALNWIKQQNQNSSSKFYQKVDLTQIAVGGHSLGSMSTFAIAANTDLNTTIHVAGGSFNGNGGRNLKKPALMITGETDFLRSDVESEYRNTNSVPVFFTMMDGVDHIMCAREALPIMCAWLRWFLYEEDGIADIFLDRNGEFCTGKHNCDFKGWD